MYYSTVGSSTSSR